MTRGDLHEIAPNLVVIEGHHPHAVWEDPDLPTIAVYRGERTLYLLDTGVGPDQRAALLRVAEQLGGAEEALLLNSHGHVDHLGNNDVLAGIPAERRRHLIPRASAAGSSVSPAPAGTAGFAVSTAACAVALLAAIRLLARERVTADPAAASEAAA
jgi:glyoxylase-like metal-dependent hydrolase (beta-lactamase superfamily II)